MIKKIKPKKSIPKRIKTIETAKKIEIKNKTELIGFRTEIIKIDDEIIKLYNNIKNILNIYFIIK
jgi:hypothetical protein